MKQTAEEKSIQQKMQPGNITLSGFLGADHRFFTDIIADDAKTLSRLGITKEDIAAKLQNLTDLAFESVDGVIELRPKVIIEYISVRGKVLSPFKGQKPAPKGSLVYRDENKGIILKWSPLNIIMIRDYGFFEGTGSEHRLEPELLFEIFFKDAIQE